MDDLYSIRINGCSGICHSTLWWPQLHLKTYLWFPPGLFISFSFVFLDGTKKKKSKFLLFTFFEFCRGKFTYIPGLVYLWVIMKFIVQAQISFGYTLKTGFLPFIGGDILKAIVVFLIVWKAKPLRGK